MFVLGNQVWRSNLDGSQKFTMEYPFSHCPASYVFSPAFRPAIGGAWLLYNVVMLSRMDASIARKVKRRLLKVTPVNRLMVYGSRARGDACI